MKSTKQIVISIFACLFLIPSLASIENFKELAAFLQKQTQADHTLSTDDDMAPKKHKQQNNKNTKAAIVVITTTLTLRNFPVNIQSRATHQHTTKTKTFTTKYTISYNADTSLLSAHKRKLTKKTIEHKHFENYRAAHITKLLHNMFPDSYNAQNISEETTLLCKELDLHTTSKQENVNFCNYIAINPHRAMPNATKFLTAKNQKSKDKYYQEQKDNNEKSNLPEIFTHITQ